MADVRLNTKRAIALWFIRARESRGWTQAELSRQLGVASSNVSQFEGGWREMQISTLARHAAKLGVGLTITVTVDGEVTIR